MSNNFVFFNSSGILGFRQILFFFTNLDLPNTNNDVARPNSWLEFLTGSSEFKIFAKTSKSALYLYYLSAVFSFSYMVLFLTPIKDYG